MPSVVDAIAESVGRTLADGAVLMVREQQEILALTYPPPSAAGEPPHRRSGLLQASAYAAVDAEDKDRPVLTCGNAAPHAEFLEEGTERMEKRPFLEPLREKWEQELPRLLAEDITAELGAAAPVAAQVPELAAV
jgi:hypothetical protein